jgi:hypothetical protein
MVATVNFDYMTTSNAPGTFLVHSTGFVQGVFVDDPTTRNWLKGGVVSVNETIPMYGGLAINTQTQPSPVAGGPVTNQGPIVSRATNVTLGAALSVTGFTVFNQAYGMISSPQSPVPLAGSNYQIMFFDLGSNARIPVNCASTLASLEGGSTGQQVSWDFVGQQLIPFVASYNAVAAGGITSATYTSATGALALTFSTAPLGASIGANANGVFLNVQGLTGTGVAPLNGNLPITGTGTAGTVVTVQAPSGLGALTIVTSGATLTAGGGALNVKLLEIQVGNNMTVNYSAATNSATWNFNGNVAVIQI